MKEGTDEPSGNQRNGVNNLLSDMSEALRSQYLRSVRNEPAITQDIQQIVDTVGGELIGLEFTIKDPKSFQQKIEDDIAKGKGDEIKVLESIYDAVRYTSQSSPEELADNYQKILDALIQKGYTLQRVKNTWTDPDNAYKGINAIFRAPSGEPFEFQFHTKESFEIKHSKQRRKMYEEFRLSSTSEKRRAKLNKQMMEMNKRLITPVDIENIK